MSELQRVKKLMSEKNIASQEQLSEILRCQRQTVNGWFTKGIPIPSKHLVRLLEVYKDINPRWLLFGEGDMYKPVPEEGDKVEAKKYIDLQEKYTKNLEELMQVKERLAHYETRQPQKKNPKQTS